MQVGLSKRARTETSSTSSSDESEWFDFDDEQEEVPRKKKYGDPHSFRTEMVSVAIAVLMRLAAELGQDPYKHMVEDFKAVARSGEISYNPTTLRKNFQSLIGRLMLTGSPDDAPRSGRRPKVDTPRIAECVMAFKAGVGDPNNPDLWYGFTSISDAAQLSVNIARVMKETGIGLRQLWRRMNAYQLATCGRKFRKITIRVRYQLSLEVKAERLMKARIWARWTLAELFSIFWLDEKQEVMKNIKYRCYAPDDLDSYAVETTTTLSGNYKKLKYVAVVNAWLGPVYFRLISGTTDLNNRFKVRASDQLSTSLQTNPCAQMTCSCTRIMAAARA